MTEVGIQMQNGLPGLRRNSVGKTVCQCCPYGYHIDLDFVRFCEMMARDGSDPSPSKRQRRERRRQRQSMEVLLGLTSPIIWNIEQLLPTIVQESSPTSSEPPPPPTRTSSLTHGNDGLKKAVQDFEATLERTSKKKSADVTSVAEPYVAPKATHETTFVAFPTPQDLSSFVDFDISQLNSAGPLKNIREQMAISLERMRELEEKVRIIPNLQNQLNSLHTEKSELTVRLEQLKTKLTRAEDELRKSRSNSLDRKSKVRDIGVTCAAVTREVGIAPIVLKCRTIGTETNVELRTNGSQTLSDGQSRSTMTELLMADMQCENNEKKAKRLSLKDLDVVVDAPLKTNKGVQASIKEPVTILRVVEKREASVQVEETLRQRRDAAVTAKPKTSDISIDNRPKTRDIGSSEDRTTDLMCDRCRNIKTKTIGVGLGNVKAPDGLSASLAMPSRSKSFDYTKVKVTRNVAVGTVTPVKKLTSSKHVDTQDFTASRIKHVGSNTNKMKLVDAAVEVDIPPETTICDSCKNDVKSAVKAALAHHGEGQQPSKIPRPKSAATTPVMDRKKFVRQDTYTKITPQKESPDFLKRTKHKLKSPIDRLDSHPEEKVEVTLRKKNRTEARPLSQAEHRLSKDLKDCQLNESSERYSSQFEDFCFDYDEHYDDDSKRNSQMFPENALFQPIQDKPREKIKPSKEMKAAMKVVNDSLSKYPNGLPRHLKNASNIIQQEWFKVSSTASANPLDVEDYLDSFEEVSSTLLEYVVNLIDNNGNTAMHYAVSHGNFDVVSILLDSKVCNINKTNAAGYTCIMLVSLAQVRSETHRQVVRRLFQLADVNIRAKQHGQTALMLAVSHGRLDMVKLLLEAGADPNIQDGDGSTALMCAAEHGHTDIVKHILAHPDCDPSIVDCDGSTALAIAMEAGNRDIGVVLYAREHFTPSSRGSSPYTSLKQRRSKATASPHSRTPTSPNPNRRSDHSV